MERQRINCAHFTPEHDDDGVLWICTPCIGQYSNCVGRIDRIGHGVNRLAEWVHWYIEFELRGDQFFYYQRDAAYMLRTDIGFDKQQ